MNPEYHRIFFKENNDSLEEYYSVVDYSTHEHFPYRTTWEKIRFLTTPLCVDYIEVFCSKEDLLAMKLKLGLKTVQIQLDQHVTT